MTGRSMPPSCPAPAPAPGAGANFDIAADTAGDTVPGMPMTLRLTEEETEGLRARAAEEGTSMQEVARRAIRLYVADRPRRLASILDTIVTEDAELLRRLGS